MPNPSLTLWVNSDKNLLLQGWQSNTRGIDPILKQGDTIGVELHWVRDSATNTSTMVEVEFSPSATISMAVGVIEKSPTYGTFTLTFGSDETTALQYNATATQVQTALNALPSITAVGGVTVSLQGGSYRIFFNDEGVITDELSYSENDLFPTSSIGIIEARAGSATARAIYQIRIKQSPVAYTETFINQDPPVTSVTLINAPQFSGDNKTWRLTISPQPIGGTFTLQFPLWKSGNIITITTEGIPVDATAQTIAAVFDTYLGTWKGLITVEKVGAYSWDISTALESVSSLTALGSGVKGFSAKYCELSLNNVEVENLLGGEVSVPAVLEIEVIQSGIRTTLIQSPVIIVNDLIDEADYTIVSRSEVMPVDSVVRFDTSQALTEAQKVQARNNIGAVGGNTDVGNLASQVTGIDNRVGGLESTALTTNQRAAITGATSPSATNLFATEAFVASAGAGYAPLSHTQAITSVTGLSAALAGKAATAHTHAMADVLGLDTAIADISNLLATKANTSHSHSIGQVTDLTSTLAGKLSIADFNTQIADFVTDTELNAGLNQKAGISHTHGIPDIANLSGNLNSLENRIDILEQTNSNTTPLTSDQQQAIAFSDLPTASNVFITTSALESYKAFSLDNAYVQPRPNSYQYTTYTGNLTTTIYTHEVLVIIDGNPWAIPARILT